MRVRQSPRLRLAVFSALTLGMLLVAVALIAREEFYLRTGDEIVLQSVPVDPVDLLRGQYMTLSYVAQSLPRTCRDDNKNGEVFVRLERQDRYWMPVECTDSSPSRSSLDGDAVIMKARIPAGSSQKRVEYPQTDRYYVPDGTEAPNKSPDVVLSVTGNGNARIKRLEIDGEQWP